MLEELANVLGKEAIKRFGDWFIQKLSGRGLLSYEGVMSIELDAPNTIVINPDALALEPEIRRQMMRGLH